MMSDYDGDNYDELDCTGDGFGSAEPFRGHAWLRHDGGRGNAAELPVQNAAGDGPLRRGHVNDEGGLP